MRWLDAAVVTLLAVFAAFLGRAMRSPETPPEDWRVTAMTDPRSGQSTSIVIHQAPGNPNRFLAFYCGGTANQIIARVGLDRPSSEGRHELVVRVDGDVLKGDWRADGSAILVADVDTSARLLTLAGGAARRVVFSTARPGGGTEEIAFGVSTLAPLLRTDGVNCPVEKVR